MSVDYRAIYGYGFCVSDDMIIEMDEDKYDEFLNSEFTYRVDSWRDGSEYFFGLNLCSAEPGYIFALPIVDNYAHEDFVLMMKEFKKFFPDQDTMRVKHYLINQVW